MCHISLSSTIKKYGCTWLWVPEIVGLEVRNKGVFVKGVIMCCRDLQKHLNYLWVVRARVCVRVRVARQIHVLDAVMWLIKGESDESLSCRFQMHQSFLDVFSESPELNELEDDNPVVDLRALHSAGRVRVLTRAVLVSKIQSNWFWGHTVKSHTQRCMGPGQSFVHLQHSCLYSRLFLYTLCCIAHFTSFISSHLQFFPLYPWWELLMLWSNLA